MSLDLHGLENDYSSVKEDGEGKSDWRKKFVILPEGKGSVIMRFLPPAPAGMFDREKNPFYQSTRIHKVNGKSIHDNRDMIGGKWVGNNPVANYLRWLWKESEQKYTSPSEKDRMQNLYRELKALDRYYFNVIVRSETDENGNVTTNVGPKIYSCGKTVLEMILRGILGDKELSIEALGDVTHFKTGRDFKLMKSIKKSGDRTYPSYEGSTFLAPSPAGTPEECDRWMSGLNDLVSLRRLITPEEMDRELKIHLGVIVDTGNNESGFDPKEYQKPSTQTQVSVESVVQAPKAAPTPAPAPTAPVEGGESMADDDFLAELRGI